jgi:hypothetical protein
MKGMYQERTGIENAGMSIGEALELAREAEYGQAGLYPSIHKNEEVNTRQRRNCSNTDKKYTSRGENLK